MVFFVSFETSSPPPPFSFPVVSGIVQGGFGCLSGPRVETKTGAGWESEKRRPKDDERSEEERGRVFEDG